MCIAHVKPALAEKIEKREKEDDGMRKCVQKHYCFAITRPELEQQGLHLCNLLSLPFYLSCPSGFFNEIIFHNYFFLKASKMFFKSKHISPPNILT